MIAELIKKKKHLTTQQGKSTNQTITISLISQPVI